MSEYYFEFECPRCGSSYFGSDGMDSFSCHDEYNKGCGWHGTKKECSKYPSAEAAALAQMQNILESFGLQITLKTLTDSLEKMIEKRGKDHVNQRVLKELRETYQGYLDRYEPEIPDDYDFDMG
jgi:hypothetical protein